MYTHVTSTGIPLPRPPTVAVCHGRASALGLVLPLTAALVGACRPVAETDLSANVFGPGETVRFEHPCAQEFGHVASAWVLFADPDTDALALARLQAGWVGALDANGTETPGVGLFPSQIRLARPPAGPVDAWRLVFRIGSAERGPDVPYLAAGEAGGLAMSEAGKARVHSVPNGFAVPGPALSGTAEPHDLALIVRSMRTGAEVTLRGPRVSGLAAAMRRPQPVVRVLRPLEVLDPTQEGGLAHTIGRDLALGHCIDIGWGLIRKFERVVRGAAPFDPAHW